MRSIEEQVVTEYLQLNGFLTLPLRQFQSQSKRSENEEGIDLYARNRAFRRGGREPSFLLFSSELPWLDSALVCVRGWHGQKAALASMTSGAEMKRHLESIVVKKLDKWLQFERWRELGESNPPKRILVAPVFPTQEPYRTQIVEMLQAKGVAGLLSFKSMLLDIVDRVDTRQVYPKSDLLQLIRCLKTFDLVKDSQMEFLK